MSLAPLAKHFTSNHTLNHSSMAEHSNESYKVYYAAQADSNFVSNFADETLLRDHSNESNGAILW